MPPKVSVVIPVYNRAHSVLPTLRSVQEQTFADFECIVVDDGSKDGDELRLLVEGLQDDRFRYVRRENGGGGAARNTGIDEARGEIVAFLDSDDQWLPEKLRFQCGQIHDHKSVAYCSALVDRGGRKKWIRPNRGLRPGEAVGDYLFVANQFIQTSTIALPTEIARRVKWDASLPKGQDLDFALRLQQAGCEFLFWSEPLVIWNDVAETGRTSRAPGAAASETLLIKHADKLSPLARRGFKVTYLAYDLARERPVRALLDVCAGAFGGVPLRVVGRQFLRSFLPREIYRRLVDRVVTIGGTKYG